jgi:Putative auto-transporter adhesin, head GIN domain
MKNLLIYSFLVLLATLFSSCYFDIDDLDLNIVTGRGQVQTENRPVANFTRVQVSGSVEVDITASSQFAVEASAYENLLPILETYVQGNTLVVRFRPGTSVRNDNARVRIMMPTLAAVQLSGSGNIDVVGGASLLTSSFEGELTGSGNLNLRGNTALASLRVTGSGNINAQDLFADEVRALVTGSGNIRTFARNVLQATISGSGDIIYWGNPQVTSNVTGSGRVRRG